MPPLAAIERFFERLFERPSARLFRTRLQPVQLQRRIERAMEAERLAASDRTLVPNRFVVRLHPDDLEGFEDMEQSLASELADAALVFARAHHYTLVDRPRVDLLADDDRRALRHPGRRPVRRSDRRPDAASRTTPVAPRTATPMGPATRLATMVFAVPQPAVPTRAPARPRPERRDAGSWASGPA